MRPLRRLCAALLSAALVVSSVPPAAFAAGPVKTASVKTTRSAWTGYFSGGGSALYSSLGLKPGNEASLKSLTKILGSSGLEPTIVASAGSSEKQTELIRTAVADFVRQAQGRISISETPEQLEETYAQFSDAANLLPLLSPETREGVMQDRLHVFDLLGEAKLEQAKRRLAEAQRAWGSSFPRSDEQWGQLYAIADATSKSAPLGQVMYSHLLGREEELETALYSPLLNPLQQLFLSSTYRRKAKRFELLRSGLAKSEDTLAYVFERMTRGQAITKRDRKLIEDLREYVPGLDPDMAVMHEDAFDLIDASGWQTKVALPGETREKGLITVAATRNPLWKVAVVIHEGFHQGDQRYDRAESTLQLLLGKKADADLLFEALLEGYTEWRTEQTLLKLVRDGFEKKSPIAEEVARLVRSIASGPALLDAEAALRNMFKGHGYAPFVRLAETIIAEPGGLEALDAFVARGDIRKLHALLGTERLRALGRLSGLREEQKIDRLATTKGYVADSNETNVFVSRKMQDVIAGKLAVKDVASVSTVIGLFVAEARKLLDSKTSSERIDYLDAFLRGLSFETYLPLLAAEGAAEAALAKDMKRVYAGTRLKRLALASWQAFVLAAAAIFLYMGLPAKQYPDETVRFTVASFAAFLAWQIQPILQYFLRPNFGVSQLLRAVVR